MRPLDEGFVFWKWWSGFHERGSEDLSNGTNVASWLANFLSVFTSIVYGKFRPYEHPEQTSNDHSPSRRISFATGCPRTAHPSQKTTCPNRSPEVRTAAPKNDSGRHWRRGTPWRRAGDQHHQPWRIPVKPTTPSPCLLSIGRSPNMNSWTQKVVRQESQFIIQNFAKTTQKKGESCWR